MPSIFGVMKRIVQGKPIFDDPNQSQQANALPGQPSPTPQAPVSSEPQSTIHKGDASTFPVAYVKRVMCRLNGNDMHVYCYIRNNYNETIELHSITFLGRTERLEHDLRPGEEREFLVYEGSCLPSQQYPQATLKYKTETGDYFESHHDVHYLLNPNKTYSISELRLHLPIRDIYE
jgi:hypothetical protein